MTIALNPNKYYERFVDASDNKKHKGLHKSTPGMDFDFSNGISSLPYGHPSLEKARKQKNKYRNIHKVIQTKKDEFLKEENKVIQNNPRLDILNQIFNQVPLIYELKSESNFFKSGFNTTKDFIKNGRWK